mgnify:CR=1 FL=1
MVAKLMQQQERLVKKRSVLILIDDVVLSGPGPIVHFGHAGSALFNQHDDVLRVVHHHAQENAQVPGRFAGVLLPMQGVREQHEYG